MPKANLPMGVYGIFVPATDGAWAYIPEADWGTDPVEINGFPGVYVRSQTGATTGQVVALLNVTRFLQQIAMSPNAALGGQFGANVLAAFDLVYEINTAAPSNLSVSVIETKFRNGVPPDPTKNAGNTPALVVLLPPGGLPVTPNSNNYYVIKCELADYWLIGQNQPDTGVQFGGGATVFW
jgi:hypothetical protein